MILLFAFVIWLGPSAILLYRRHFWKGAIVTVFSVITLFAFSVWLGRAATPYLPANFNPHDGSMYREIIQKHIIPDHPGTFYTYQVILGGLWIYSVVAAILCLMNRHKGAADLPGESTADKESEE
jgi:hypothetical protein